LDHNKIFLKNYFLKKGKKTRVKVYVLLGVNTAVLIQMVIALIKITQLKNKTK